MKRRSFTVLFLFCVALFVLFLLSPDIVQRSAHESVLFCASVLIPSLFPGFVLSDLLISLSVGRRHRCGVFPRLFCLPSALAQSWVIGLLAGFPSATDCTVCMVRSGVVTKKQGERCLAFTNNPGIVFVVCAVGSGLFGSFWVGLYLWGIQTVASVLIGVVLADRDVFVSHKNKEPADGVSPKIMFPKAVVNSVSAVLNICGFVVFFRVLIDVLTCAVPLAPLQAVLAGLLEMTCGISQLGKFGFGSAIAVSAMLGWSGFSVHFQILNIAASSDLSLRYYFPGKLLQTILSSVLAAITYPMFFSHHVAMVWIPRFCMITLVIFVIALRFRKEYLWKTKSSITKKID